jgi:glycosyltransferase involved in cell wall biosynthesis
MAQPGCSIILPTHDRAAFLPEALQAIAAQQYRDWELIIIDDGSTDDTAAVVGRIVRDWSAPVQYVYQPNAGAYAARNRGLDLAAGRFIAFYDSDDLWLAHHLQRCIEALEQHDPLDMVFAPCQIVNHDTGQIVQQSTLTDSEGQPRPITRLNARVHNDLHIIDDPSLFRCALNDGLWAGLQNTVIRAELFDGYRFDASRRNAEDRLFVLRQILAGRGIGWLEQPHVLYRIHQANSSSAGSAQKPGQRINVARAVVAVYEQLLSELPADHPDRDELRRTVARETAYTLGYNALRAAGHHDQALAAYRRSIAVWPWDWRYWWSCAVACLRARATLCHRPMDRDDSQRPAA